MPDYVFQLPVKVTGARDVAEARRALEVALSDLGSNLDFGLGEMPEGVDLEWPAPGEPEARVRDPPGEGS